MIAQYKVGIKVKRLVGICAVTVFILSLAALALGCQQQGVADEGKDIPASEPYQLTIDANNDEDPFMLQDSHGVYWLAWCSNRSGNGDIWCSNSTDGINWSEPMPLTSSEFDDWYPSMFQDSRGIYHLSWMSWRSGNYDIWCSDSEDGGEWSEPLQLTTDAADDWVPALSQDSSGTFWMTWSSGKTGNQDIWYFSSQDGENWSNATQFTTDAAEDDAPWLLQDSNGTYWVVWHSFRQGNYDIFYSTSTDGVNWSEAVALTDDSSTDFYPFLLQDSQGSYWLAWTSNRSDMWGDIWYCSSQDGLEWSEPKQLTEMDGKDYTARLMEDSSGVIWVTWVSERSGNLDVWYAKMVETGS